ncbi:MAG: VIT domain-containing protein [Planctomycetaceae bacterium]
MNEQPNNLQRLLKNALRPPMHDDQIEKLLRAEANTFASDEQLERIGVAARTLMARGQTSVAEWTVKPQISNVRVVLHQLPVEPLKDNRRRGAVTAVVVAAMSLLVVLLGTAEESNRHAERIAQQKAQTAQHLASIHRHWMTAVTAGHAPPMTAVEAARIAVGGVIETGERERRRLHLPDGSVLYVNESSTVKVAARRRIEVAQGEVFVEVVPQFDDHKQRTLFEVVTPEQTITALGTKFGVDVRESDAEVLVTQGRVRVSNNDDVSDDVVEAGQRLEARRKVESGKPTAAAVTPALRASTHLAWARDLMTAATGALVPASEYAGGAIITVDPDGQKTKLSLRKYHVDVHIEDGFARTTIDQTYFNHTQSRLEGTFHFPLPPDASLSRLAMYVNGRLMEGGMAERQHARNTFEKIVHKMKDPALLEWVDGSTFKMRVFPLEARQEKRIVLSYTQRLNSAYGKTEYRFPAGHSMDVVGKWSTHVLVKNGAKNQWHSSSHDLASNTDGHDLVLSADETNCRMERDLVLELSSPDADGERIVQSAGLNWSRAQHDDQQYLMLRFRPVLPGEIHRKPRHWVFLFEASADRNPLLARTQIEVIRTLLKNAEHSDTFNIVAANTEATAVSRKPLECTAKNITNALDTLEQTHLIGALDLQKAFQKCAEVAASDFETVLVHTGSAIPVLGEQDQQALIELLPDHASYVGVGIGRRWSRPFMKAAAGRSGGYVTQINPDERVSWRAFELSSVLNTPRLLDVEIKRKAESGKRDDADEFLTFADTIVQGEEICAVARFGADKELPKSVVVTGKMNGKPWKQTVRVKRVADKAEYLPRTWAKLQIDRLAANGAAEHRDEIIQLSKSMYVMSPFTSLLVLENEEMYAQHGIDRGRKDHWALYPCPEEIAVVHEPIQRRSNREVTVNTDLLSTIRSLPVPQLVPEHPGKFSELVSTFNQLTKQQRFDEALLVAKQARQIRPNVQQTFAMVEKAKLRIQIAKIQELKDRKSSSSLMAMNAVDESFVVPGRDYVLPDVASWSELVQTRNETGMAPGIWVLPQLRSEVTFEQVNEGDLPVLKGNTNDVQRVEQIVRQLEAQDSVREERSGTLRQVELQYVAPDLNYLYFNLRPAPNVRFSTPSFQQSMPVQPFYTMRGPKDFGTDEFTWELPQLQQSSRPMVRAYEDARVNHAGDIRLLNPDARVPLGWRQAPLSWGDGVWDLDFKQPTEGIWLDLAMPSDSLFGNRGTEAALSSATFLDDDIQYFPVGPEFKLSKQVWAVRRYVLEQQQSQGQLTSSSGPQSVDFRDLLSHAPGLNTWHADVLALRLEKSNHTVADGARKFIERARSLSWERVTFPATEGREAVSVLCDGAGRHVYDRVVSEGLREEVRCDGKTLIHSYPELGLAAEREFSRFHRDAIAWLVPWLLPAADELAIEGDVVLTDERTVAVRGQQTETQYVFGDDGRLTERRLVVTDEERIIWRMVFDADGTVRLFDGDSTELSVVKLRREPAAEPELKIDEEKIVLLPMPVRSSKFLLEPVTETKVVATLTSGHELRLILAYMAEGNGVEVARRIHQHFFSKGDRRDGFYVLLSRFPGNLVWSENVDGSEGRQREVDLRPSPEGSPLRQFVRQSISRQLSDADSLPEFDIEGPQDGFFQHLAASCNLFDRWRSGRATKDRTAAQIKAELQADLTFVSQCRSDAFGWTLLNAIQLNIEAAELHDLLAQASAKFEDNRQLRVVARCCRVRSLFRAGKAEQACQLYRDLLLSSARQGNQPPLVAELRRSFIDHESQTVWEKLVSDCGVVLMQKQRYRTALGLSVQLRELGDEYAAGELLDQLLAEVTSEQHPDVVLNAVEQLRRLKQGRAEDLMGALLTVKRLEQDSTLWRYGAQVADDLGHKHSALDRLERAIQLEFENRPDVVDVKKLRTDYGDLMNRYEAVIDAAATMETSAPEDLYARIVRAADQWRSLDNDATSCCHTAARLLSKLNRKDMAWSYLTTPLAEHSGESSVWTTLAEQLTSSSEFDLADMAWAKAFEFEQTNPEILLAHAKMRLTCGRQEAARRLLKQIVDSDWQPRFDSVTQEARMLLP